MTPCRALLLLLLSVSLAYPLTAAPSFQFEADRVAISGVTPKTTVHAYSLSREAKGTYTDVVPREITLTDEDGDGVVIWPLGAAVAPRSIWFAVDMSSGAPAVAAPAGYAVTRVQLDGVNLKKASGADITQLAFGGTMVEFIVVRPGTGAWRAVAARGGPADEGTDPDRPTISVEKLEAKGGTTELAPKNLKRGDVVLMVNSPSSLRALPVGRKAGQLLSRSVDRERRRDAWLLVLRTGSDDA
ncbi:MAG TPA: hypothetical protein VF846_13535 [Thermoanaerobaculia bacterium]|jgi:hypothetical protein